jgi:hypothetical protein
LTSHRRANGICVQETAADSRADAIYIREIATRSREIGIYWSKIATYTQEIAANNREMTASHQEIGVYRRAKAALNQEMNEIGAFLAKTAGLAAFRLSFLPLAHNPECPHAQQTQAQCPRLRRGDKDAFAEPQVKRRV